ncbi:MAG: response regulator [Nitrospirales bacterium]|nr:response regulator [Nitrospira sp.]MDR4500526.1 response regulator [Nitrospirales bacterium]
MISQHQCQQAAVLIVDDQMTNIMLLENILQSAGYTNIHSTTESTDVVRLYREMNPDLICLDIRMPEVDGFQVMGQLKIVNKRPYLPILVLTSEEDRGTRLRALESGAKDFLNKPFDKVEVLMRIRNLLETSLLHKENKRYMETLEETVLTRTQALEDTQREVIHRLGRAAEYRDNDTGSHIVRMSHYAAILAQAAGMTEEECKLVQQAMPMHDIGKIGIPDDILLKPDQLTSEEWHTMRRHTLIGAELLSGSDSPLLQMAEIIALTHHEKWDGSGYPNKLSGEDIPLPGRICAICDIFDALTSQRPYKEAWAVEDAIKHIHELSGTHLDPHLVERFEDMLPLMLEVQRTYVDVRAMEPVSEYNS